MHSIKKSSFLTKACSSHVGAIEFHNITRTMRWYNSSSNVNSVNSYSYSNCSRSENSHLSNLGSLQCQQSKSTQLVYTFKSDFNLSGGALQRSYSQHCSSHIYGNENQTKNRRKWVTLSSTKNVRAYSSDTKQVNFGILFDIDGVLARGGIPLMPATKAIDLLRDHSNRFKVPVVFVTNACNRNTDKAEQISSWFNIEVSPDQIIHAPTPVKLFQKFHSFHTLVTGQEHHLEIAQSLGFTDVCTVDDVKEAYPLLDVVDRKKRALLKQRSSTQSSDFRRIEAILMIGEPTHWETNLQLLIDLLLTEGQPSSAPPNPRSVVPIPIIACNLDLLYMAEACMPRFGHGAFLLCLEALYQKLTGKDLVYARLVGKPCEITYRFAEHTASKIAQEMGMKLPLKRLYFLGDNPHVDIVGANLYNRYIKLKNSSSSGEKISMAKMFPECENLSEQTVEECLGLLVATGVYHPRPDSVSTSDVYLGHRDISYEHQLSHPHKFVDDVFEGVRYILSREGFV